MNMTHPPLCCLGYQLKGCLLVIDGARPKKLLHLQHAWCSCMGECMLYRWELAMHGKTLTMQKGAGCRKQCATPAVPTHEALHACVDQNRASGPWGRNRRWCAASPSPHSPAPCASRAKPTAAAPCAPRPPAPPPSSGPGEGEGVGGVEGGAAGSSREANKWRQGQRQGGMLRVRHR